MAAAALRPRRAAPISLPNRCGPQPEVDAEIASQLERALDHEATKDAAVLIAQANADVLWVADLIGLIHPRSATLLRNAVQRRCDALDAILKGRA